MVSSMRVRIMARKKGTKQKYVYTHTVTHTVTHTNARCTNPLDYDIQRHYN